MSRVGLLTGSLPFAGLPTSPSTQLLERFEGASIGGARIVTRTMPVSYARLPGVVRGVVAELRPAFVLSLGLALGAPVLRVERLAVDTADFRVADNEGAAPRAEAFAPHGSPPALRATWDAERVVDALLEAGLPAAGSWHAGTHLCNLTLFTFLDALRRAGSAEAPCGFLHLPYTPELVAGFLRGQGAKPDHAPTTPRELPSMALDQQAAAVRIALATLAGAAGPDA